MEIIGSQQLAAEGQAEYNKAEYLSAAKLYKAAADGYLSAGDEMAAAEMANNSSVAFLKSGQAESAWQVVRETDKIFAAHGDTLRQAMALGNQGAALEGLKQLDQAVVLYAQSAELLKQAGENELRAYVLQSLSAIQLRRGKYLEAYGTMGDGIMGIDKPNLKQKLLKMLMQLPFKFMR
jgi:tetratricopeptide (TPR) repeat protein